MVKTDTIGIVGLGLVGRSIASCLLWKGLRVVAFTKPAEGFAAARESIAADIEGLITHRMAPPTLRDEWQARYTEAGSIAELAGCDFVIESVFEDLDVKGAVFDELEAALPPHVPIGTNTSAIPISVLQQGRRHPQRVVGMHWCPPCHLNRFLEVIRGEQTSDAAADAAIRLGRLADKDPGLVRKDVEGFVINRLGYAVYREALHLLETGVADAETIDAIFRNVTGLWASRMGPFRWMDLTGLPAYASAMQRVLPTLSNATEVPAPLRDLVAAGAQGVANGRGFYQYKAEEAAARQREFVDHCWRLSELRQQERSNPMVQPTSDVPMKQAVFPGSDTSVGSYSPGITAGQWVFVSGQGPLNPETKQFDLGDIEHETRLTLSNVRRVLEAAGCSMRDVVKVTVHLRDVKEFARFDAVYRTFFTQPFPARTTVQSVLGMGISVEIDAIAIRGCGGKPEE